MSLLRKIQEEQALLREGIGLQVKNIFIGLNAVEKQHEATLSATTSAYENRDLHSRAYQNELVETQDVVMSQIIESMVTAKHLKTRYEHIELRSKLDLIIGSD